MRLPTSDTVRVERHYEDIAEVYADDGRTWIVNTYFDIPIVNTLVLPLGRASSLRTLNPTGATYRAVVRVVAEHDAAVAA